MTRFFLQPIFDYVLSLRLLNPVWSSLLAGAIGLFLGWWIYVPVHELLHAWGCITAGGEVTELQISEQYGAEILRVWFPFVTVGSEYAGQLTGFDTRGSDWIYAATVYAPFLITIVPGVPLYTWLVNRARPGILSTFVFGLLLSVAYAPFISVFGDFYELGSIVASNLYGLWGIDGSHWRSDDLFLLITDLFSGIERPVRGIDISGVTVGFTVGLLGALLTYYLGSLIGRLITGRPEPARRSHSGSYRFR